MPGHGGHGSMANSPAAWAGNVPGRGPGAVCAGPACGSPATGAGRPWTRA